MIRLIWTTKNPQLLGDSEVVKTVKQYVAEHAEEPTMELNLPINQKLILDAFRVEVKAGNLHHNDIIFETDTQIISFNEKGQPSDFLPIEICIEDQLLDQLIDWGNL